MLRSGVRLLRLPASERRRTLEALVQLTRASIELRLVPSRSAVGLLGTLQAYEPIEPVGSFAVLVGQIDGGNATPESVGDESGGAADTAAGVEDVVVAGDGEQVYQLMSSDAAHGVEILKRRKVGRLKTREVQPGGDERTLDVLP